MNIRPKIERLVWDSAFFGLPVGITRIPRLSEDYTAEIKEEAQASGLRCVYILAESDSTSAITAAVAHNLHPVDVRLELEADLSRPSPSVTDDRPEWIELRRATDADTPALRSLAGTSHRDSRFHYDSRLSDERCDELYRLWIESSLATPIRSVIVAKMAASGITSAIRSESVTGPGPAIDGYCAFEACDSTGIGRISLIAVAPEARGKGVGCALLSSALTQMIEAGAKTAAVPTQARNVAAQRLYQRHGFLTRSACLWYHLWIEYPFDPTTASEAPKI